MWLDFLDMENFVDVLRLRIAGICEREGSEAWPLDVARLQRNDLLKSRLVRRGGDPSSRALRSLQEPSRSSINHNRGPFGLSVDPSIDLSIILQAPRPKSKIKRERGPIFFETAEWRDNDDETRGPFVLPYEKFLADLDGYGNRLPRPNTKFKPRKHYCTR